MATHFDDFGSATAGATPTGWTLRNRDVAEPWTINAFDDSGNKVARCDNNGQDDNLAAITKDSAGSISGACEILTKWRIQAGEATNRKSSLAWIFINTAATAGYAAMWRQTEFRILEFSGGGENNFVGSAYTGFSPSANTWYWTRFSRDGSGNFSAKFWADGSAEPGSAHITGNNTAVTSGLLGVGGFSFDSTSDFDLVGIGTAGDAAPSSGTTTITGSGAGASSSAAVSASGAIGRTASGTLASAASTLSSTGERMIPGTGVLNVQASIVSGSGVLQVKLLLTAATSRELVNESGSPVANLTGIEYEWYDTEDDTSGNPTQSGTFDTDAGGEATIQLPNSSLTAGQVGTLLLYHPTDDAVRGVYRIPVS